MSKIRRSTVDLDGILRVLGEHLYSTPTVALRELVQNAHDSCTRRLIEGDDVVPAIRLEVDPSARRLTIQDNGAGLTEEELGLYLATLGRGFTRELREKTGDDRLIGAFGLGFLTAYVVADRVEVFTTSRSTPDQTSHFVSRDGQRYTVCAVDPRPIGTAVVLHLRDEYTHLGDVAILDNLLRRYCCLLPYAVQLGDVRINANRPPWETETDASPFLIRRQRLDFVRPFEERFEPICTIPVRPTDDIDVHGLIWVQDGASYLTSDRRNASLFVRGMLIDDDARDLLPEWAGFTGAILCADGLTPTASREDVQRNARWTTLVEHVRETLITGLADIAQSQRAAWRRVLLRHNESLLGAALCDPRLFQLVQHEVTVPTSEGDLTMDQVLRGAGGHLIVSTGDESGAEQVRFRALNQPVVQGERYGALSFCRVFASDHGHTLHVLGTRQGDAGFFRDATLPPEALQILADELGQDQVALRASHFTPTTLPCLLVPDRDALLKRRIDDDELDKRASQGILGLARAFTETIDDSTVATLYVNVDSPVIQALLGAEDGVRGHVGAIVRAAMLMMSRARVEGVESDLGAALDGWSAAVTALVGGSDAG